MLFQAVGKEPNFFYAPLWLFDTIINSLQWVSDTFNSEQFENFAELGRIGKYYAVEDMLTTDPEEKFGTMTLQQHYNKIAVEGQEYDPYTTMYVVISIESCCPLSVVANPEFSLTQVCKGTKGGRHSVSNVKGPYIDAS